MEKLSGDDMADILKLVGTKKFFEIKTGLQLKELTEKKIESLEADTEDVIDLDYELRKPVSELDAQKKMLQQMMSDASK